MLNTYINWFRGVVALDATTHSMSVPIYDDHNGNVVCYVSETGTASAQYVYDPYGNIVESSGPLADVFAFGFSTKCRDRETGLVAYQRRFYSPGLGRWLNRDPIEERGGENLYGFCRNNTAANYDRDGCAYFALRKLKGFIWLGPLSHNPLFDVLNIEIAHELVFLGNQGEKGNWGYSNAGVHPEEAEDLDTMTYYVTDGGYNDCVMEKAIAALSSSFKGHDYSVFWFAGHMKKCNCQDYCSALRRKYAELEKDKKVRCECGLK